ncbi:hydroxysqualene dehydroxylase HpnE [Planctomicrobium sp. SH664]|uniref:hydroxysqualene dehydroxylase HpnE n=1 Tax=Planctomicrobium sp. SH664 TaxID=3448125 RepID=UPI003F5B5BAA
MSSPSFPTVIVVGGGLAGIAAAWSLRSTGCPVTLLEARTQLGGRATTYVDPATQVTIDNCQHVSMGCCTNLRSLCEQLGFADALKTAPQLNFVAPDGQITPFRADPLPAPFHLLRAFLTLPYLSWAEKLRFAWGVRALARSKPEQLAGMNFRHWLVQHGQPELVIRDAWEVVLVSALSETLDRVDARHARKVFVDGFLKNERGWQVEVPNVSLGELYGNKTLQALTAAGVDVRLKCRVSSFEMSGGRVNQIRLRDGEVLSADEVILAVPQHQIENLLPDLPELQQLRSNAAAIEAAPITSVHLWFDRPITELPHAVLVGRLGQWLFNRGTTEWSAGSTACLYQVVISASRNLDDFEQSEVVEMVCQELREIWPAAGAAALLHGRLITERRAVLSVVPGIDTLRPDAQSPLRNLQLAGDWTQTGWPGTMEGAVRSGFLAAESLCRRLGISARFLQPDLPVALWSRLLLGVT